jgi:hypothetical protein
MKKLIILLFIILSLAGYSQTRVVRNYSDTSGKYIVKYFYNQTKEAKISVYKLVNNDTVMVGEAFRGKYVANESLKKYILKARKLKDNR